MNFKNFTPHTITMNNGRTFLSEGVARVSNTFTAIGDICDVTYGDICDVTYGDITGLPEPQADTYYIVSALVLAAAKAKGRTDCVAPATGHPQCVRKDGFIVSVPCFVR